MKISKFIVRKTNIIVVEANETLLKDQLLEWVDEAYYRTLQEGDELMYNARSLF